MWFFGKRKSAETLEAERFVSDAFCRALGGICPGCKQSLQEHEYAGFASLVIREDDAAETDRLIQFVRDRDWKSAIEVNGTYDPELDALWAQVLRCPYGAHTTVMSRDAADPANPMKVVSVNAITEDDFKQLRSLIDRSAWVKF